MQASVVVSALEQLLGSIRETLPNVLAGLVFLTIAAVGIKLVMLAVRAVLRRALPGEAPVYRQFIASLVLVFLWFGVGLSFLSIVGLTLVAASLGTATGFLALGVSYALSDMIADAVSGVYLLRDPDFNPGDTVTVKDTTGEVLAIELRKTRFDVDGNVVVRANADIEQQWTKVRAGD
ncbi:mechanosensitive ion channel domain-containing protein [Haloarcula nitratireducens]|uniref:Mechanosensitive ion channel family protein n=1 Tax=Haloarcula nitratireducens TaxID=2487749 RepID=A0AAW4PA99_9EURY|nr:mechanosensitive ion channel domain-containing protein [Halomicroarcula nitratireducens]MBX0294395.1 mechanosensitive ion channel family protein [Halomicroarcula nitratireducens]